MADSSRPRPPRPRGVGSRNPTGRPRRIAGQTPPVEGPAAEPVDEEPVDEPVDQPVDQPAAEQEQAPAPVDDVEQPAPRGLTTTVVLAVTIVLLLLVGAAELVYLNRDDTPAPSASRPIVVGDATRGEAVETAARSTEEILSTSYENYDDEVAQAADKMTATFAEQYRQTADSIKDRFIAQKTQLQVKAVGQSVVQASPEQVQALLFLNQYVQKVVDGQDKTDFAQYRALVTVVHTDHGWLVSGIDTK